MLNSANSEARSIDPPISFRPKVCFIQPSPSLDNDVFVNQDEKGILAKFNYPGLANLHIDSIFLRASLLALKTRKI